MVGETTGFCDRVDSVTSRGEVADGVGPFLNHLLR